eukprot:1498676-Amphidinium_carterae.1
MVHDTVVAFAKQAGLLARVEQTIHVDPVIEWAMPLAPPTRTANAITHDLTGLPICVDVRVTSTPPHGPVPPLCSESCAKLLQSTTSWA